MFGDNSGFGMDKVNAFAPPPPQMEQPKQEGGKSGMGLASGLLGIASLIPGPQQPFIAGAAAASKLAGGIINKDPMQAMAGLTGAVGAGQQMFQPSAAPAAMPSAAPANMMQQATQGLQGGAPGAAQVPSFNGYEFQFNPYQTSQYPFFR
jgi:hypothetical protein